MAKVNKILFAGHSHSRRLDSFMRGRHDLRNFKLPTNEANIQVFGIGGLKITDLLHSNEKGQLMFDFIGRFRPDALILSIGDNDIGNGSSIEVILRNYIRLVNRIRSAFPFISNLVFTQILPRHGRADKNDYNEQAHKLNSRLFNFAQQSSFVFMKYLGLYFK